MLYELCVQLNKDSKEILWWRIVGMTDHQIHERIDGEIFNDEIASCNNEVNRLIPVMQQAEVDEEQKDNIKDLFRLVY